MDARKKALENLLVSKVRIKVLEYFLATPSASIHLRGAVRLFDEEINAVRREFERLEKAKMLHSETRGNKKYFYVNKSHDFIIELTKIFNKTYGLGGDILTNLPKLGEVQFAILTPAYTMRTDKNDHIIDLMVVGDVRLELLQDLVEKAEKTIGREIHYSVMKLEEFQIRKRRRDQFLIDLMIHDNLFLVGKVEEFLK